MPATRYFELCEDVGVDPGGNLQPAQEIGLGLQVTSVRTVPDPANPARRIPLEETHPEELKALPIPGTRMFETGHPRIAQGLAGLCEMGLLREIDPPTKPQTSQARQVTQDARERSGKHTEPGENDTTDGKTPTEA